MYIYARKQMAKVIKEIEIQFSVHDLRRTFMSLRRNKHTLS